MSDESYLDSWQLALHDKADSTRRLYREILQHFAKSLPEGRSLIDATRRDCQAYFAGLKAQGRAQATTRSGGSPSGRSTAGSSTRTRSTRTRWPRSRSNGPNHRRPTCPTMPTSPSCSRHAPGKASGNGATSP